MTGVGVNLDPKARLIAEKKVSKMLEESNKRIQAVVPDEVRATTAYKKEPEGYWRTVYVPEDYELQEGEEWVKT